MEKSKIFKVLEEYKKLLETKDYEVIYIGLYGSQNYNCDDSESDIDAKAIILPSLHDIVFRKVTSKTIETEIGNVDVKDLITFYDVIKKGNFSYVESIDTEYWIGDEYIKDLFKQFRPNKKSILGAMFEKRKALTHEYPSKIKEFEKWGFDPKQYHHIVRLYDLLRLDEDKSYLKYEKQSDIDYMIGIKRNIQNSSKEVIEYISDRIIELAKNYIPDNYEYIYKNIDEDISNYIELRISNELVGDHQ